MIHRNICPICGNENPEGSEFCQVCKVDLNALPDEVFPTDAAAPENSVNEPNAGPGSSDDEMDLDSPVPVWLQKRFLQQEKQGRIDFDSYANAVFGVPDEQKSSSPAKVIKPRKKKKEQPVFQPPLENLIDPPLLDHPDDAAKSVQENVPSLNDFLTQRPAKKWDDVRKPVPEKIRQEETKADPETKISSALRPNKKRKDQPTAPESDPGEKSTQETKPVPVELPLWWNEDPALVETDTEDETLKSAEADDPAELNSVSPTKLVDSEKFYDNELKETAAERPSPVSPADEFRPESGSLISDLMDEINSSSVSPAPQEMQENKEGVIFYSGNHPDSAQEEISTGNAEPEKIEIEQPVDQNLSTAEALDQILRGIGYQVEGEIPAEVKAEPAGPDLTEPAPEEKPAPASEDDQAVPAADTKADKTEDTAPAVEGVEKSSETLPENDPSEKKNDAIPVKEDEPEEQDIPWDLFGSQEMSLPTSPEETSYRTFSRNGIPDESGSTTYQQRMMSSLLGKIIQAENFVPQKKSDNPRKVSLAAKLFWTLLAIGGVLLILLTGITDKIEMPSFKADIDSLIFYQTAAETAENTLVVLDYTPAYSSELDSGAEKLLETLEEKSDHVYLAVLNPAAMPGAQQIMARHDARLEFAGWWPAGVISIRSRLASGDIPDRIWLLTSEIGSVRNWAEQLAAAEGDKKLYVMASGQLQPLLKPYLTSGLVEAALSSGNDLRYYGEEKYGTDRTVFAVWYLAALLPLAWLGGLIAKFLRSDPNYGRKSVPAVDKPQYLTEKEPINDGKL